ncbi:hypothetical protein OA848_01930 [Rickettsiales bacterium]|nr:hypothetical protein [Rickettsiales bacterium]
MSELKKKNYFRYLQLLFLDSKKAKSSIALIFLLEYEMIKIFYSTEEPLLRKVKYQWLIEELEKRNSDFNLANNLIKCFKKLSIKKEIIRLLNYFIKIENDMKSPYNNLNFFKKVNILFNEIFKKIMLKEEDSYKISFFSQLMYFYYLGNEIKNSFNNEFEIIFKTINFNELDCFEKTFIKISMNQIKKQKFLKISKLEFLFKSIFCIIYR